VSDLINLHIKNKYYIDISKKDRGCIVKTPANIFYEPQYLPEVTEYTVGHNVLTVNREDLMIPNYAIRAVIFSDICMKLIKLRMPKELLLFFDKLERKKVFSEIVDGPKNSDDMIKDAHMMNNMASIILGTYDTNDAQKNGVSVGFSLIYDIFAKGGL